MVPPPFSSPSTIVCDCSFNEIIQDEESLLVPPSDPRALHVQAVAERLIQALQDETPVSCATFPRESVLDRLEEKARRRTVVPSAQARAGAMPFMPEVSREGRGRGWPRGNGAKLPPLFWGRVLQSSNPEKRIVSRAWSIWVIDLPKVSGGEGRSRGRPRRSSAAP